MPKFRVTAVRRGDVKHDLSNPHPLTHIAMQAFRDRPHHDGTSFAPYFERRPGQHRSSVRNEAEALLQCLEGQGRLYRDRYGWWRLV